MPRVVPGDGKRRVSWSCGTAIPMIWLRWRANFAAARQGELCLELMIEHVAGGIMLEIQNEQGRTPIRLVFRCR